MIKVGIIGGAGYTAGELIRLLINHPDVEIKFINSSSNAGNKITEYTKDCTAKPIWYLQMNYRSIQSTSYSSVQHTVTPRNS